MHECDPVHIVMVLCLVAQELNEKYINKLQVLTKSNHIYMEKITWFWLAESSAFQV